MIHALVLLVLLLLALPSVHGFQFHLLRPHQPPSTNPPPPTPHAPPALGQQLQRWGLLALAVLGPVALGPSSSQAFDAKGVKLFEDNCSSCHVGGSNIIGYARAKTLKVRPVCFCVCV